jgi:hypothetical protein
MGAARVRAPLANPMRLRPVAAALLLTLAPAALATPVAFAQSDATTSDARERFKEGVRYYEAGQYERARASFLQAYALKKHPDVLFNLANSCLKSGHPREAEHDFSQWLHDGDGITPQKRADAEKGRDEARTKLGRIDLLAPTGTPVTVDGEAATAGESVYVDPGAHVVKFRSNDGTDQSTSVAVLAGQAKTASYGKTATPPPPVDTTSNPTTPPPADEAPSPPPADTTPPPADTSNPPENAAPKKSGSKATRPPDNVVPLFVFLGASVVGFGVGIGAGVVAKGSAQSSATDVANSIQTYLNAHPSIKMEAGQYPCSSTNANVTKNIGAACAQLNTNNNRVNTDATVGNIGLAVGIAGIVGAVIYWAAASRSDSQPASAFLYAPRLTPVVGPNLNGFAFTGSF